MILYISVYVLVYETSPSCLRALVMTAETWRPRLRADISGSLCCSCSSLLSAGSASQNALWRDWTPSTKHSHICILHRNIHIRTSVSQDTYTQAEGNSGYSFRASEYNLYFSVYLKWKTKTQFHIMFVSECKVEEEIECASVY